jgi:hypothetical protein
MKSERATGSTQLTAPHAELALSEECWHRSPRNCDGTCMPIILTGTTGIGITKQIAAGGLSNVA